MKFPSISSRWAGSILLSVMLTSLSCPGYAEPQAVLVETTPATTQQVAQILHAYGILDADPDQIMTLSLPRAGVIGQVWVRLGQRVHQGDPLLEVITAPDARMQYLQAQSAVEYAQRELERQQRLLKEQLATHSQVDAANKSLSDAQNTLQALEQRGQNIDHETLRAPRDGIVTQLDVTTGQRVSADTTALLIAAGQWLIARLGIEPEDLSKLNPGIPVVITPVFVKGITIHSQIRDVHAMVDPTTHLVEVLAPIPPEDTSRLVLGSRITGQLRLNQHEALVVPRSAVLSNEKGDYVFRVVADKAQLVAVKTGIETDAVIEIEADIKAGEKVVTSGNYELNDGMSVREAH